MEPKLRLFLSVDIAGSTQFKQILSHKNKSAYKEGAHVDEPLPSEPWLSPILEFYEQISSIFEKHWHGITKVAAEQLEWTPGERPSVWKAVGDELIFTKVLSDHRQAYVCISAWLETVREYRKRIKTHSSSLDLKCAAWIAGFPINNAEVILDHHSSVNLPACDDGDYIFGNLARLHDVFTCSGSAGGGIRDFIGPSIDTGFRVASASSPRRFVLAADLALILAHICGNLTSVNPPVPKLEFYYEGRKELKGVTNGTPYPVFWLNAADADPLMDIEDAIENRHPTSASDVKTFCERFLDKNKDTHVMRPFIVGDTDEFFRRVPEAHLEKMRKLAKYWENENQRRKNEAVAADASEDPSNESAGVTNDSTDAATVAQLGAQLGKVMPTLETLHPPG